MPICNALLKYGHNNFQIYIYEVRSTSSITNKKLILA